MLRAITEGSRQLILSLDLMRLVFALSLALVASALAKPPEAVLEELRQPPPRPLITRADQLPPSIRGVLARTFDQTVLFIADAGGPYQESCSVIVTGAYKPLPSRRLRFAFPTNRYFIVYYEAGVYGHSANALVFSRHAIGAPKFVWGGAEPVMDPANTPAALVRRIDRGKLMDDLEIMW
jgi:hypothetical protein